MADEILYSTIGDLALSEQLSGLVVQLLADRNALPNHPALMRLPSINGIGSTTQKISEIGLMGYDKLASSAESAVVANTALTDGSVTVAVSRYTKAYEASDLARLIDSQGIVNAPMMALDAVISASVTLRDIIANLVDNFSNTVGSTGVDATFVNFLDATTQLEVSNVEGPYLAILHPVQFADIRKDMVTTTGGAIQWNEGSQALLNQMKGAAGYRGLLAGVDVYTTTDVPTANAGADYAGGMFGRGALAYATGTVPADPDLPQVNVGEFCLFEKDRTARAALTAYVSHAYMGASEVLDAAGVTVISDA
jgi:hypothetical protein